MTEDVQPDGGVELQAPGRGGYLGLPVHHSYLPRSWWMKMAMVLDFDDVPGELRSASNEPCLEADVGADHLPLDLRPWRRAAAESITRTSSAPERISMSAIFERLLVSCPVG